MEKKRWTKIKIGEIKSADRATQLAMEFLKRYYPWVRPMKATRTNHIWVVEADVGAFQQRIAKVHIDVKAGSISEYDVPKL